MRRSTFCLSAVPALEETRFWSRCAGCSGGLAALSFLLFLGILSGALLSSWCVLENVQTVPLLFSGIPAPDSGFLACFTTFLLNLLIFLTVAFLLGLTAFGILAVPALLLLRGVTVGLGAFSFFSGDFLPGLGRSAIIYAPGTAASLLLVLLFSLRALVFSNRLRKVGFSSSEGSLDFHSYWRDYLHFVSFSVIAAFMGSVITFLGLGLFR